MKFFRGISVTTLDAEEVIANIRLLGCKGGEGRWQMEHERPRNLRRLHTSPGLSTNDTRPGTSAIPVVCACGELNGAAYYAFKHNASTEHNVPILIEFVADISDVAIDGKDFLYTAFQMGSPDRARPILEQAFGPEVLKYAEKAWSSESQDYRIAQCDLAIHDPDVIAAHHGNNLVLGGRYRTVFKNAFTIALPIQAASIVNVWRSDALPSIPPPDISLGDILLKVR